MRIGRRPGAGTESGICSGSFFSCHNFAADMPCFMWHPSQFEHRSNTEESQVSDKVYCRNVINRKKNARNQEYMYFKSTKIPVMTSVRSSQWKSGNGSGKR